jgi:hypothetical protein
MECCARWYDGLFTAAAGHGGGRVFRVLLFTCSHERNAALLLHELATATTTTTTTTPGGGLLPRFDQVIFCPSDDHRPSIAALPNTAEVLSALPWLERRPSLPLPLPPRVNDNTSPLLQWEHTLAAAWRELVPPAAAASAVVSTAPAAALVMESAATAMLWAHQRATTADLPTAVEVLVTGSLYLVGSALSRVHNPPSSWADGMTPAAVNENKWPSSRG